MKSLAELAQEVGLYLTSKSQTLVTAESCTGGGISYWLTSIPGSSAWFERGFVTYSNQAKSEMLCVSETILQQFGAVSRETAIAMADGAIAHSHATVSIAVTGIAGPDGGSSEKPVGTVWIAWGLRGHATTAQCFHFKGDRQAVREQTIANALIHLLQQS